ncbi:hypothetical protein L218DRAFT_1005775 [Marasmius fiardii PR-910]|nr:hypothetical protein L218DRAFT_1005775 [Marasmius fiardii PR-910]
MSHSKAIKSTQLYVDNDAMSWVTHVEEASGTNSQADDDNESDNDASSEMSFETCFSQDSNAGEDGDESLMYEIPRGFFPDPEVAFEISGQHSEDDSKDESEVESFCFCELDLDKEDNPEGGHESKRGRMKNVDEHPPTFAHDSNEETGVNVKNNIAKARFQRPFF